jgi:hypothetical protein
VVVSRFNCAKREWVSGIHLGIMRVGFFFSNFELIYIVQMLLYIYFIFILK